MDKMKQIKEADVASTIQSDLHMQTKSIQYVFTDKINNADYAIKCKKDVISLLWILFNLKKIMLKANLKEIAIEATRKGWFWSSYFYHAGISCPQ